MKAMKICADGATAVIELPNVLEAFQQAVGGYIETVTLADKTVMIVDEEGRLKGKPHNAKASAISSLDIVGDALVCGVAEDEFTDIPEGVLGLLEQWFRKGGRFDVD